MKAALQLGSDFHYDKLKCPDHEFARAKLLITRLVTENPT